MIPQKHIHVPFCLDLTNSYASLKTLLLLCALPPAHAHTWSCSGLRGCLLSAKRGERDCFDSLGDI